MSDGDGNDVATAGGTHFPVCQRGSSGSHSGSPSVRNSTVALIHSGHYLEGKFAIALRSGAVSV
jgi:hypothetical protein